MFIARVVGNVVATQKNRNFEGKKLLIVQPLDSSGEPYGIEQVAVDAMGAGVGELVLVIYEGGSARLIAGSPGLAPLETVIAGIIDEVVSDKGTLSLYK